ncbi:MAG TPA: cupin domain-containing protein [Gaiellaceae bacterium]|nr:cupin domain-containing protein [Gaiellaceae bacterium]
MIRPGEQLENPVTGEVMIFHETAAESGGELVRVETIVQPDGFVAAAHVHPTQTERFDMLEGTVEFRVGGELIRASAGDEVVVPPGTPHRFRNDGDEAARFLMEVRPALKFESLIETMFTLAADGKTGRRGLPGPFRLAVIAREHFDTVRLPFPPAALQRAALALGAPLGRALGYEPTVVRRPSPGDSRLARGRGYDRGRPHGSPERRPG